MSDGGGRGEGGGEGKPVGASGNVGFFFAGYTTSFEFASIRTKPSLGVKEDQRMLTVNPSL